jgi:hypothetical protein
MTRRPLFRSLWSPLGGGALGAESGRVDLQESIMDISPKELTAAGVQFVRAGRVQREPGE